jgi:PAS domain S-box-containing protein
MPPQSPQESSATVLQKLRESEEKLRENEKELNEAQRIGKIGNWSWDIATDKIFWSPEYYHLIGFDPTKAPPGYKEHLEAYTKESQVRLDAAVQRQMQTGEPYEIDLEFANPKSICHWITARSETIRDAEGKVIGLRGTAQDITERKRIEIEREQYFKFFQISTDIMVIADPNGAFKKVNPTCLQLLGYSEEELIARPFIDFVHPDDKQSTLDEMARQIKIGSSLNFENRYMRKDDSVVLLSWRASYDKDEGITYATARNITELRKAEEKFKVIFENANDGMVLADTATHLISLSNAAFCRMFGYSLEEMQTLGVQDLHPKEDTTESLERFGRLAKGDSTPVRDMRVQRKDGSVFYVDVTATLITLEGKKYLLGVFRDATERREAEKKERKHFEDVENMNKLMVGRELKMIELKKENERLAKQLAQR